ncbi:MAG: 4-hydroxy-tetrahydrodipicolinate reductase [Eubacteriales bacterium]|nr:4-hydroxy-tetrahydrodipicolinate reductase [Eubacteriales bacterium]
MSLSVIINGANGRIGKLLTKKVEDDPDLEIAALVSPHGGDEMLKSISEFEGTADVVIDFSVHTAVTELCEFCTVNKIPAVICTTGFTESELDTINKTSEYIPVFRSANMSVGIALLTRFAKEAAAVMKNCDIELVEAHHNRKLDAPSGTALMLADAVREVRPNVHYQYGRSGASKRQPDEIGIHSIRMGNVTGIHELYFATDSQTITIKHEAHDPALFAEGAIAAAKFLVNCPKGMYNMDDLIGAN